MLKTTDCEWKNEYDCPENYWITLFYFATGKIIHVHAIYSQTEHRIIRVKYVGTIRLLPIFRIHIPSSSSLIVYAPDNE